MVGPGRIDIPDHRSEGPGGTRTQKPGEPLQDIATAIEMLALRAYPNLPADYVAREAGKAFAYGISNAEIKIQLLLGGENTLNEALRQALEI
jgi:hypothetical protein